MEETASAPPAAPVDSRARLLEAAVGAFATKGFHGTTTRDIATAWNILQYYDVEYIIVSGLERAYYPPESLAKFEAMVDIGLLNVTYESGNATLYGVNADAQLEQDTDVAGLDQS